MNCLLLYLKIRIIYFKKSGRRYIFLVYHRHAVPQLLVQLTYERPFKGLIFAVERLASALLEYLFLICLRLRLVEVPVLQNPFPLLSQSDTAPVPLCGR